MAYVPGSKTDVFISFCHLDNDPTHDESGWVTDFERHLRASLRKQLIHGKEVEVWRDVKMSGNDVITSEIEEKLRGSAVLVCLVSPSYLSSDGRMGCLEELEMFWSNTIQGMGVRVDNKLRLFKVMLLDVPLTQHPENLRGLRGYRFFDDQPPKNDWSRQYLPRPIEHPDNRYWNRLDELVLDISKMLAAMREKVDRPLVIADPPSIKPKAEATVYLAEPSDDLQDDYYWVRAELERKNLRVLPDERLPSQRPAAESVIRDALAQSQIAVHLFSKLYGRRFGQGEWSVSHLQYGLAVEVARQRYEASKEDKIGRIAWIPVGMKRESFDSSQRNLLKTIEMEEIPELPIDVQSLPHDQLQRLVDSIVAKVLEPSLPPPKSGALIYVTGNSTDLTDTQTKSLIDYMKRRRHDVLMPTAFDDQAKRDKQDEAYMKSSDGLVILYGSADSEWVVQKALNARNHVKSRRKNPLAVVVFDGPPEGKVDLNFDFEFVPILKSRTGFRPQALHPFLQRLEGAQRSVDEDA